MPLARALPDSYPLQTLMREALRRVLGEGALLTPHARGTGAMIQDSSVSGPTLFRLDSAMSDNRFDTYTASSGHDNTIRAAAAGYN